MFKKIGLCFLLILGSVCVVNVYASSDTISVVLEVENSISGNNPTEKEHFHYQLTTTNKPLETQETIEIIGEGKTCFKELIFDEVGYYEYRIKQIEGISKDYIYDTVEYVVSIYIVYNQQGNLCSMVQVKKEGSEYKVGSILFHNQYLRTGINDTSDASNIGEPVIHMIGAISMLSVLFITRKKMHQV